MKLWIVVYPHKRLFYSGAVSELSRFMNFEDPKFCTRVPELKILYTVLQMILGAGKNTTKLNYVNPNIILFPATNPPQSSENFGMDCICAPPRAHICAPWVHLGCICAPRGHVRPMCAPSGRI